LGELWQGENAEAHAVENSLQKHLSMLEERMVAVADDDAQVAGFALP
jgi:hypothetical protein